MLSAALFKHISWFTYMYYFIEELFALHFYFLPYHPSPCCWHYLRLVHSQNLLYWILTRTLFAMLRAACNEEHLIFISILIDGKPWP
ncbi:hypothetical protein BDA99DRAFT_521483 [Phascolomyces articulosus]|uniref:Uncharacterized protein n=1 Tax=Phascolomyces articulosus TaxID=60185 RepID=A0AAD5JSQ7_9FUNG|nr:hypothetical protein BDA99DRAFT_521483 [Phascolomyces articulosus]